MDRAPERFPMLHSEQIFNPWQARTVCLETAVSTNDTAKELARSGAAHGTVVLADHQSGGRGRLGRSFSSPAGLGIYCSVILRFDLPPQRLLCLTPLAAEALRRAVSEVSGLQPQIKWINDLVLDGKKLCGILTELVFDAHGTAAVVGFGINCKQRREDFPPELREMAVSLSMYRPTEREPLICAALRHLQAAGEACAADPTPWMDSYRAHCLTLGRDVQILQNDTVRPGHVLTMDNDGALQIRLEDGTTERIFSGEVSVRGLYGYI